MVTYNIIAVQNLDIVTRTTLKPLNNEVVSLASLTLVRKYGTFTDNPILIIK